MAGRKTMDTVDQDTSKYFNKRARKSVNYDEGNSNIDTCGDTNADSDSDFEVEMKDTNSKHKNIQVKRRHSSSMDISSKLKKSKASIGVATKNTSNICTGIKPSSSLNISKPCLSEGESSDSSDDDMPLAKTIYNRKDKTKDSSDDDMPLANAISCRNDEIKGSSDDDMHISETIYHRKDKIKDSSDDHIPLAKTINYRKGETKDSSDDHIPLAKMINYRKGEIKDSSDDHIPLAKTIKIYRKNKIKGSSDDDMPLAKKVYHRKVKTEENLENEKEIEKERLGRENLLFMDIEDEISVKNIKNKDPNVDESIETKNFSSTIKKFSQKNKKSNADKKKIITADKKKITIELSSEESSDNWEDVDEIKVKKKKKKKKKEKRRGNHTDDDDEPTIKGVEVSIDVDPIHTKKKRKTREEKMLIWLKRLTGQVEKERQRQLHKCHLLCFLANALNKNACCNNTVLKAICLSLIPEMYFTPVVRRWDINHLRRFTTWFQKEIPSVNELLLYIDHEAQEMKTLERIHVLVIMIRSLGFLARIVTSLQPCTAKVNKSEDVYSNKTEKKTTDSSSKINKSEKQGESSVSNKSSKKKVSKKKLSKKKDDIKSPYFSDQCKESEMIMEGKALIKNYSTSPNKSKATKTSEHCQSSNEIISVGGNDIWAEVYLKTLRKWVCLELVSETINAPDKCEAVASRPLQYVIGIDNNQQLKDVTCRYAEKWLTLNRKLRIDREWWAETIHPYRQDDDIMNSAEDAQMKHNLMEKDLPKTISECKDNPLYALQRHLLKFQAIYPESAAPVGYIHSEPIYSRELVHELHSRDAWMKKARCVIPEEEPYKIVKGRTKFNERHLNKDPPPVPIFGLWQTEVYIPPPVVNGKVTKNEYGNIELYQPSMLPEGAVHLPMSNMLKIAGNLKIDCAQALMSWDFHCGFSHPVFEGIVVAKEYEDVLLDAWNKDEEEKEKKEKEKREKAIYDNWKKLIKGLLIRERLEELHKQCV